MKEIDYRRPRGDDLGHECLHIKGVSNGTEDGEQLATTDTSTGMRTVNCSYPLWSWILHSCKETFETSAESNIKLGRLTANDVSVPGGCFPHPSHQSQPANLAALIFLGFSRQASKTIASLLRDLLLFMVEVTNSATIVMNYLSGTPVAESVT
jgi:hypothetical protein